MNLFRLENPRGFQHHYLYYNERKARLQKLEKEISHTDAAPSDTARAEGAPRRLIRFGNRPSSQNTRPLFFGGLQAVCVGGLLLLLLTLIEKML